jgi:hypothetical protein
MAQFIPDHARSALLAYIEKQVDTYIKKNMEDKQKELATINARELFDRAKLHACIDTLCDAQTTFCELSAQLRAMSDKLKLSPCTRCYKFIQKSYCAICNCEIVGMCGECCLDTYTIQVNRCSKRFCS